MTMELKSSGFDDILTIGIHHWFDCIPSFALSLSLSVCNLCSFCFFVFFVDSVCGHDQEPVHISDCSPSLCWAQSSTLSVTQSVSLWLCGLWQWLLSKHQNSIWIQKQHKNKSIESQNMVTSRSPTVAVRVSLKTTKHSECIESALWTKAHFPWNPLHSVLCDDDHFTLSDPEWDWQSRRRWRRWMWMSTMIMLRHSDWIRSWRIEPKGRQQNGTESAGRRGVDGEQSSIRKVVGTTLSVDTPYFVKKQISIQSVAQRPNDSITRSVSCSSSLVGDQSATALSISIIAETDSFGITVSRCSNGRFRTLSVFKNTHFQYGPDIALRSMFRLKLTPTVHALDYESWH